MGIFIFFIVFNLGGGNFVSIVYVVLLELEIGMFFSVTLSVVIVVVRSISKYLVFRCLFELLGMSIMGVIIVLEFL